MRPRISPMLLAVVALLIAACGGGAEPADTTVAPTETTSAETTTTAGAETTTTAGALPEFSTSEEGTLTVGSDIPFPPFEFQEGGELTGFDVELMEEIASRLGLEIKWVDTAFDTIFTQLAGGQFDAVASATTITPDRSETVDFSIPYYRAQQALTINSEQTPDIQSVDDLGEGDTVAVQTGTTGETYAQESLAPNGVQIRSFPDAPDTFTTLEAGQVTGVIFDEPAAVDAAAGRPSLEVVDTIDTDEEYGFPVNPENDALLEAVNQVLQEIIDDGTYQQIYEKYFPEAPSGSVLAEE